MMKNDLSGEDVYFVKTTVQRGGKAKNWGSAIKLYYPTSFNVTTGQPDAYREIGEISEETFNSPMGQFLDKQLTTTRARNITNGKFLN